MNENKTMNWLVYIILCSDDSLYTGITTDVERRFAQHVAGTGAKYFRGHSARKLVYLERDHDRRSASRREIQIKKLRAEEKRLLIASANNRVGTLDPRNPDWARQVRDTATGCNHKDRQ